jgi:hypothetical protein
LARRLFIVENVDDDLKEVNELCSKATLPARAGFADEGGA